jgi:hypothetical protein
MNSDVKETASSRSAAQPPNILGPAPDTAGSWTRARQQPTHQRGHQYRRRRPATLQASVAELGHCCHAAARLSRGGQPKERRVRQQLKALLETAATQQAESSASH